MRGPVWKEANARMAKARAEKRKQKEQLERATAASAWEGPRFYRTLANPTQVYMSEAIMPSRWDTKQSFEEQMAEAKAVLAKELSKAVIENMSIDHDKRCMTDVWTGRVEFVKPEYRRWIR